MKKLALFTFSMFLLASLNAQEIPITGKVETHIGALEFDYGVPSKETSEKLYYELDYLRTVQAYLWALPIVDQAQWRQSYLDMYDLKPNQWVYTKTFQDRSLILTANETTHYLFDRLNVKDKAAVLVVPAGPVLDLIVDFWQSGLADIGVLAKNSGHIGNFVITGGIMLSHRFFTGII